MGKVGSLKLKSTSTSLKVSKLAKTSDNGTSNKYRNNTKNSNISNSRDSQSIDQKPVQLLSKKTPAQLAFEAAHQKKQKEKLPLLALKSHKEKVAEYNEYLGKLSEHHDIPKVGPG